MALTPELEAQILRFHHVEKWPIGTIARHLYVHHGSVERVLRQAGLPRSSTPLRPSRIDAWSPCLENKVRWTGAISATSRSVVPGAP